MLYLDVAINVPINQTFTYSFQEGQQSEKLFQKNDKPAQAELFVKKKRNSGKSEQIPQIPQTGKRVEVKFGNRKTVGCILAVYDSIPETCKVEPEKIRPISKILDAQSIFTQDLIQLAKWMSCYYLCSIGETVAAMLPSGKKESTSGGFSYTEEIPESTPKKLSAEQMAAVNGIFSENTQTQKVFGKNDKIHYLYGKTGSGKTEVFLQCAEHILKQGKGVIYLVPEIALTHQVIEAVTERFGNTVAVLHSELTPNQKLCEWHRILKKEARVVIGARSAVFAPVPDLGLIIIDEEHDGSYKSGTTPRYHARQVAMYRAAKFSIPLVMGSATPSAEAWHLMQSNVIHKHVLTKRLAGGAMPQIRCIDLTKQKTSGCISQELEAEIKNTLANGRQTILFLNRRGFTHFFRCNSCGFELNCKNCSVPLTYHKHENRLRCHYCGWSTEVPHECPKCGSLDVGYSGFGTEFIETEVKAKFPKAGIVRIDTDSLTKKGELQEKLTAFRNGEYDIMLGTQMVAKGLNFPNLQLVGIILADTGLHIPDFRAAERTFALITQVSGRAGRFFPDGKVLVQTYNPDRAPIFYAVKGLEQAFYNEELEMRRLLDFPPYSRLIRLVFRAASRSNAENTCRQAAAILRKKITEMPKDRNGNASAELLGPAECPIEKIAMNHRFQILLKGKDIKILQKLAAHLLYDYQRPQEVYIETDVDPVNLL